MPLMRVLTLEDPEGLEGPGQGGFARAARVARVARVARGRQKIGHF